ncbi:MAG: (4Fe-4S)-binding protein [Desulfobacteraceae bacterium]|nr:MAG: (4Fe-4S)-binding protein [Desulfobacteraceae bacterium]
MKEILILSGKGGTGKTSLAAAFAHLAKGHVICDLDVDAPDMHLILKPENTQTVDFYSGHEALINNKKCTACGKCLEMCRYGAIDQTGVIFRANPIKCEGCKVCVAFCPADAIEFPERFCGRWFISDSRFGPLIHAQLFPGEENSGRLVALLRQKAKEMAKQKRLNLILSDGTPGIGCPVISSLSGVSLAVIVTEPTPSGRHDLERVAELCSHFRVPVGIIINKSDLNPKESLAIETFSREKGLTLLGRLPHDPIITRAMVNGQTITEYAAHGNFANQVKNIWRQTMALTAEIKSYEE